MLARPKVLAIAYMMPVIALVVAATIGYPAGPVGAIPLTACSFVVVSLVAGAIGCWQGFVLSLSTLAGSAGGTILGRAYYFDYNGQVALIGLSLVIAWFLTIVFVGRTVRQGGSVAGPSPGT